MSSKVRALVVGAAVTILAACASAPTPKTSEPDLTGTWVLTTQSQMGVQDAEMTVQQTGKQLSGKLSSPQGPVDYTGTIEGNAVAFSWTFSGPGQALKLDYSGTVSGNTMSGKAVFGQFGEGTFTAKKK